MPALVDRPAFGQRQTHLVANAAGLPVLGREETVAGGAEDLVAVPAEEGLRPRVPIGDGAVAIGHDDGEIDGALKNMAKVTGRGHSSV